MKLSVNKAKLTGFWARNCATIQQFLILKFPGLSRNGPQDTWAGPATSVEVTFIPVLHEKDQPGVASHAGVFRGARISSRNTSSPKNACVGG